MTKLRDIRASKPQAAQAYFFKAIAEDMVRARESQAKLVAGAGDERDHFSALSGALDAMCWRSRGFLEGLEASASLPACYDDAQKVCTLLRVFVDAPLQGPMAAWYAGVDFAGLVEATRELAERYKV